MTQLTRFIALLYLFVALLVPVAVRADDDGLVLNDIFEMENGGR